MKIGFRLAPFILICLASASHAVPITYKYTGFANSTATAAVALGDTVTGQFTYDNEAVQTSFGGGPNIDFANYANSASMTMSVNGHVAQETNPAFFVVGNNRLPAPTAVDLFRVGTGANNVTANQVGNHRITIFEIALFDTTATVFGDLTPPPSIDFADFTSGSLGVNFLVDLGNGNTTIRGASFSLTSITRVGVPEPAMAGLLGLSLFAMVLRGRKRRLN